jgi:DNA-binding SARP family transcriptional activator/tetratricopeptide (TPR) repeat protein
MDGSRTSDDHRAGRMEFRVLGPLEVWAGGRRLPLGGPKPRAVLATLVLHPGKVVSVERFVEDLWDGTPPATARNIVQGHVVGLRRALQPGCGPDAASHLLATRPPGYVLQVDPEQADVYRFEALVARARQAIADGADERSAGLLRQALALWRGPALADVGSEQLRRVEGARLEEARLHALEARIEADLRLGRHGELISELAALVAAYPLREGLVGQLMLALHRSGRQAEALEVYRETWRAMVEELGVEPGSALSQLQRELLATDPVAQPVPSAPRGAGGPARPAPGQVPPVVSDFTGREVTLRHARNLVEGAAGRTAPTVTVVAGKAGVGKTTFAVRLADQLRSRFPDGQLFVNLRGVEDRPVDPAVALAGFLRALGVDRASIPRPLDERVSLYRSVLANRRVLVVLDNAAGEAQVRPLLPSGAGCAALVTSRPRLAGLEGAQTLTLDVFQPGEALELLTTVAGPERVAAEPDAAREIVRLCGYLPLAVRIAAARLASRPQRRLQALAERLGDERRRLHELRAGDLEVRASMAPSYQGQDPEVRRAFRLLGLLDAPSLPAWMAAVLLDRVLDDEGPAEQLLDAGLLEAAVEDEAGQARYRFHDLVRLFARELLEVEERPEERRAALERAARAYLARAELAGRGWYPVERVNLVAITVQAHRAGLWELTWKLALAGSAFFEEHSHWDDWRHTHELALQAARRAGDRHAEAVVLRRLGDLHLDQSDWIQAQASFGACLPIFGELGDRHGEALALCGLGDTHREQGRLDEARACFGACLPVLREVGDRRGQAEALRSLAIISRQQGRLDDALSRLEECLRVSKGLGDPRWEAIARRSLGMVYRDLGRKDEARACFERSLAALRELDDRLWQAYTLNSLGQVLRELGTLEPAHAALAESVTIFQELHDPCGEGWALQALGDVLRDQRRRGQAHAALDRSLTIFRQLGQEPGEAYALQSLGELLRDEGRLDEARSPLEQALAMARRLDMHACQARARASLDAIAAAPR